MKKLWSLAAVVGVILNAGFLRGAETTSGSSTVLPEVVVTGEKADVSGGTKTDANPLETPQAVSVATRERMDDEGAHKLDDVLKNVAGVSQGGYYSDWDYYRIRGFDSSFSATFDGMRGDYGLNAELFGLDRVEVLKGPIASLYGQGPLGGMVNYVGKRPRPENFVDAQASYGSYGFYEPAFDAGAVLNAGKTVYLRLNALSRGEGSFVDFVDRKRAFVAPSLTWEMGPRTKLTVLAQYQDDRNKAAFPLPAVGTVLPNVNGKIPVGRFVGETGDAQRVHQSSVKVGYDFEHGFADALTVRQKLRAGRFRQDWTQILYPSSLDPDQRTLQRYPFGYNQVLNGLGVDTNAEAKFDTGAVRHDVLVGVDYYRSGSDSIYREIDYSDPGAYIPLDLFNPVYGLAIPAYTAITPVTEKDLSWGGYFQDQAKVGRLTLTLGGRYDASSMDNGARRDADGAFSPRAGATFQVVRGVAAYGNYSRSFNPQFYSRDASGKPVAPETGANWEAGLKQSSDDGRSDVLLAFYRLTRRNVATPDPATPDPSDSIAAGEQRSQGVELEGAFKPAPAWELGVAYAYTDAEITKDNSLPVGARLPGVSRDALSGRAKYTLQRGTLKGLGFGLNGRWYSDQEGDSTFSEPFTVPGYEVLDAAVYYKRGRGSLQANFNNVFNRRFFYGGAYDRLYVLPGEPFNAGVTAKWSF